METEIYPYLRSLLESLARHKPMELRDDLLKRAIILQHLRTFDGRIKIGQLLNNIRIANKPIDLNTLENDQEDVLTGNRALDSPSGLKQVMMLIPAFDKSKVYIGQACNGREFITSDSPVSTYRFSNDQMLFTLPISQRYCLFWLPDSDIPVFQNHIAEIGIDIVDNVNWATINNAEYVILSGSPFSIADIYALSEVYNSNNARGLKSPLLSRMRKPVFGLHLLPSEPIYFDTDRKPR